MIYLEVSFSQPIGEGTLTYHLPNAQAMPARGCRVVVPVQGRQLIGYITGITTETPPFKTRPINQLVDPLPLFSPEMLQLAEETAESCVANIGEVLHAMLPGGIKKRIVRHIRIAKQDQIANNSEEPALNWLLEKDWTNYSTFLDHFPKAASRVSQWLEAGIIEIAHSISKSAGPKIIKVLKPAPDIPINVDQLTEKQKLAMQTLLKLNNAPTANMLAKLSGVSTAPISQLKKKGLVIEVEERIIRQVATEDYYKGPGEDIPTLSTEQKTVLKTIEDSYNSEKQPVLVRGVTCSGKTEVYLQWVNEILGKSKTAIVLVPEISLTPQMMKRFKDRFGSRVAILHSKLSTGERFDQWEKIRCGETPVVVGARSAVFAPLPRLGTIILDEEGEPSFKQGDSPRYHARDVAQRRCKIEDALLIMGSATPTIDSFNSCQNKHFNLVEMNSRVSDRKPPEVEVVDMRYELVTRKNRSIFSEPLSKAIKNTLQNKKQAILFLNRRGHSSFVFCRECGEPVQCSQCKVSLVFHKGSNILRCHYCGEIQNIPKTCPNCGSNMIKFFGAGTQRVESEAARYFPDAKIARLDSDTVSTRGSMEKILDSFGKGDIDILVGTQMVAKGLDFPNVTLVGILAADSLLRIPDFRASERNFSLLAQVSGRAGRGDSPGKVILQTYSPDHHSIKYALTEDYHGFFKEEARQRKEALFPPFIELASFIISSKDNEKAQSTSQQLFENLISFSEIDEEMVFGPAPAAIERLHGRFRYQLMLKMSDQNVLTTLVRKALSQLKKPGDTRVSVDINPWFML
ncbi:MAG: primosomal protein N' [Candidatus Rifleibacteriota bacterium]